MWRGLLSVSLLLLILNVAFPASALQRGSRGTRVATLQKQLKLEGYYRGPVNSYYDLQTQRAISQFQRERGLPITGVADVNTLTLLGIPPVAKRDKVGSASHYKLSPGIHGPEVAVVQQQLNAACYTKISPTGQYDRLTEVAVRRVQNSQGVFRDGEFV